MKEQYQHMPQTEYFSEVIQSSARIFEKINPINETVDEDKSTQFS